jgi:hypothetical protein
MRLISYALCAFLFSLHTATAQELKGDEEAAELVRKMLERLGGAEIWSEARTLHLEYSGWNARPAQAVDEHAWRALDKPDQRVTFEGRRSDTTYNMTQNASWLEFSERAPRRFTPEEHAQNLAFWNYDFYTILHNLARGDERITLRFEEPQTVRINGPQNADWGWFEIDGAGQPVRWGASYGDEPLEYLYGPVRRYGNINFPAWGAATDGSWRFEYTVVDVSRDPFPYELTPPPEREE